MKAKKKYKCTNCEYVSPMWIGKCPQCSSWNTLVEEIENSEPDQKIKKNITTMPVHVGDVTEDKYNIIKFDDNELNNFFGEGIICGAVMLLAGDPGIGKSSFLYLLAQNLHDERIFYFSGEETLFQLKKRAERLHVDNKNLFISNNNDIDEIIEICKKETPDIIFIDSIQTMKKIDNETGLNSANQIKICTDALISYAKEYNVPIIIVGHITKSGDIAGPKVIEHMVDVVIYFENDIKNNFRILRSIKNRFGNIDDILFFSMSENGLRIVNNNFEIINSANFYNNSYGKCKSIAIEGSKPLFIEVESLITPSFFVNPRRFAEGIDLPRLNRIIAILNKHLGENLNNYDVYVTVSNGIKVKDVAVDLAIATAIYSSKNNILLNGKSCFIGELSLSGDVITVKKLENRINELMKFGIDAIYSPKNDKLVQKYPNIIAIDNIKSLKEYLR